MQSCTDNERWEKTDEPHFNRMGARVAGGASMTTERVLMELIEKAREKCKRQYEELRTDYENFSHRMRDLDDAEHVVEERFRVTGGKV